MDDDDDDDDDNDDDVCSGFQRLILALSVAALCGSISFMLVRIVLHVNCLYPRLRDVIPR